MFKKIISLLLVFTMMFGNSAYSLTRPPVSRHWANKFWNGGGTYPSIIPDNEIPGRLYLISDVSGLWTSDDYAESWQYANNKIDQVINHGIKQSIKNPGLLYMVGKTYVEVSQNRARTWTRGASLNTNHTLADEVIAIDRETPSTLYVAKSNGVIAKSTNSAASFSDYDTPFASNQEVTFLYIESTNTYMYAGSSSAGMVRYTLADGTKQAITLTGTNALYNWDITTYIDLAGTEHFCTGAGLVIACSTGDGSSWSYTTAQITADTQFYISELAARQLANGEVRFIAHGRRISTQYGTNVDVVSSDSGDSWTSFYDEITQDTSIRGDFVTFNVMGNVYSYTADPFNEDIYYATTDGWVFKSVDGGLHWTEKTIGAMNVVLSDVKVDPLGGWWVVGMDIGLSYSANKGVLWEPKLPHNPLEGEQGFSVAGHYWRIAMPGFGGTTKADIDSNMLNAWNNNQGIILVTNSQWGNNPNFIPRVWRSADNGATFQDSSTGLPTTVLNGVAAPHRAMWGIGYPRGLACHPNGSACYLTVDGYSATEQGGIFISRDKGLTWERTQQPTSWTVYNAIAVDPTDPTGNTAVFGNSFPASGVAHWYKTVNGFDWVDSGVANYGIFDVVYNSLGTLFATGLYTGPQVYYSTNGGLNNWFNMKTLNNTGNIADGIYSDPDNPNYLIVGVNDGTSTGPGTGTKVGGSVYLTTDALNFDQATWVEITGDLPDVSGVGAIAFDKGCGEAGCIIVATEGGLFSMEANDVIVTELEDVIIE